MLGVTPRRNIINKSNFVHLLLRASRVLMSESINSKEYRDQGSSHDVSKIQTAGDNDEYIIIGNQKFHRHELMAAFGGTLNPGLSPPPKHEFANPAPLGLSAFGMTTFCLSLYNAQAMGIKIPNVVVGMAAFYGGAAQFLAGVWEMCVGNTFGATAFCSYGAFWLSYMAINVKSFNIAGGYVFEDGTADTHQFHNAVGFYLLAWALFTFMMCSLTLKSTVMFFLLFFCLAVTFVLLAAGDFTGKVGVTRAGGVLGVVTAFLGWYNAWAGVATKTNAYFTSYPIPLYRA